MKGGFDPKPGKARIGDRGPEVIVQIHGLMSQKELVRIIREELRKLKDKDK